LFEGEPGLAEEPVNEDVLFRMRSSWCRIAAASWSVVPAARLPRPFFITGQVPSTGLRSGAQAGSWITVSQSGRAGDLPGVRVPREHSCGLHPQPFQA
jgi:hypothetical protein